MSAPTVTLLVGHVLDKLKEIPDGSVHCCVTSPPYWGLRDYSRCGCALVSNFGDQTSSDKAFRAGSLIYTEGVEKAKKEPDPNCPKCHGSGKDDSLTVDWGDWVGQLGLEPTPDLYVKHIVQVFREVKRVLRDDGTLWLNMGDCYAGSWGAQSRPDGNDVGSTLDGGSMLSARQILAHPRGTHTGSAKHTPGLKPKDLVGMPWRVAFALQADGWWLRCDIIWAKPNPMPESVTDRPTKAHEYVFLLTKNARYFYDADAVRENWSESTLERARYRYANPVDNPDYESKHDEGDFRRFPIAGSLITPKGAQRELDRLRTPERMGHGPGWRERSDRIAGRNLRSVWTIPTQPYPEAHFATFPPRLVEPCIKAGTSEKGCCATCGAAWERVVEAKPNPSKYAAGEKVRDWANTNQNTSNPQTVESLHRNPGGVYREAKTIGFRPSCAHGGDPTPCVILDPFAGSGTVGKVARSLGRSAILIEIKEEYAALASVRGNLTQPAIETFIEESA